MRCFALLFLLLAAQRAPFGHHHPMPSNWQMSPHEGSAAGDFRRRFRSKDEAQSSGQQMRLNRLDVGNGAQLGIGLVHGHHAGFRLKLPF